MAKVCKDSSEDCDNDNHLRRKKQSSRLIDRYDEIQMMLQELKLLSVNGHHG